MKRFFEVKKDTKAYELFSDLFNFELKWLALEKEIEEIIKSPMKKNLCLNINRLLLSNPPEECRDQFVKNPDNEGFYKAKVRSQMNKDWLSFVKEKGLYIPYIHFIAEELNISKVFGNDGVALKTAHKLGDKYFFEGLTTIKGSGKAPDFTIEITEAEFLRLRADQLEKDAKEKGNDKN
jgi:hypothetical protein